MSLSLILLVFINQVIEKDHDIIVKKLYYFFRYVTDEKQYNLPASGILKEVFTDAFIDSLTDSTSAAYFVHLQNDTYPNWVTERPMMLWH